MNPSHHTPRRWLGALAAGLAAMALAASCGDDGDADDDGAAAQDVGPTVATTPAPTTSAPPTPDSTASDSTTSDSTTPDSTTPDAAGDEAFCRAALAAEAATMSEDPAATEAAFSAAAEAAPADIRPAVDTVIAEVTADRAGSDDFTAAYREMTDFAVSRCGFGTIGVTATEYAYAGLPDRLAPGPVVVEMENSGQEFHQVMILRVTDEAAAAAVDDLTSLTEEDLLAMAVPVGGAFAPPGVTGSGMLDLEPGGYLAVCFLPTGATPQNMPAIEAGEHDGLPHSAVGMIERFTVE